MEAKLFDQKAKLLEQERLARERADAEARRRKAEEEAAEAAARKRREAEEEEASRRRAADEAEKKRAMEAEQKRLAALEAEEERRRQEEEEARRRREEEEDARRRAEEEARAQASKQEQDAIISSLNALRNQGKGAMAEAVHVCASTLRAYIQNLAKNPQDPKFQKINRENNAFKARVEPCLAYALPFLAACGFVEEGQHLVVDPNFIRTKGPKLWDALAKLDVVIGSIGREVEKAKAAAAPG